MTHLLVIHFLNGDIKITCVACFLPNSIWVISRASKSSFFRVCPPPLRNNIAFRFDIVVYVFVDSIKVYPPIPVLQKFY